MGEKEKVARQRYNESYNGQIMVEHENGYYGCLYGKSSMSIFYKGREILYTDCRSKNIRTADDLYKQLADMPRLMELLGNKQKRDI